jgi:hypothetical protein
MTWSAARRSSASSRGAREDRRQARHRGGGDARCPREPRPRLRTGPRSTRGRTAEARSRAARERTATGNPSRGIARAREGDPRAHRVGPPRRCEAGLRPRGPRKAATPTRGAMIAFHPEALDEIERARDWYDDKRPGLGGELVDESSVRLAALKPCRRRSRGHPRAARLGACSWVASRTGSSSRCSTTVLCSSSRSLMRSAARATGAGVLGTNPKPFGLLQDVIAVDSV